MYLINRIAAILKPTQPFVDWINKSNPDEETITLDEVQQDCTVILVPEFEFPEETIPYIESNYSVIFKDELADWCDDDNQLPQNRSLEMFRQWINIELHSMVYDTQEDPIEKEDTEADETGMN